MAHPPETSHGGPGQSSNSKSLLIRCPLCHNESVSRGSYITHLFDHHRVSHQSPSFKTLVQFESKMKEVEQLLVKAVQKRKEQMEQMEQKTKPAAKDPVPAEAASTGTKMVRLVAQKSNKSAASLADSETSASDSEAKETVPSKERLASLVARTKKRVASTDTSTAENKESTPTIIPMPSSFSQATPIMAESPFLYNGPPSPYGHGSSEDEQLDTERSPRKSHPSKHVQSGEEYKESVKETSDVDESDASELLPSKTPNSRSDSPSGDRLQLDPASEDSDSGISRQQDTDGQATLSTASRFAGSDDNVEILGSDSVSAFGSGHASEEPTPSGRKRRFMMKSTSGRPAVERKKRILVEKPPSRPNYQRPCPKSKRKYPVPDESQPVARSQRVKRPTQKMGELNGTGSMDSDNTVVNNIRSSFQEDEEDEEPSYHIKPLQVNLIRVHHEVLIKRGRPSTTNNTAVFEEGTMVWAHVTGYPWWPAVVMAAPGGGEYFYSETRREYHVLFMEKAPLSRGWVPETGVARFVDWSQHKLPKGTRHTTRMNAGRKLLESIREYSNEERSHYFSKSVNPKMFEIVGGEL